MIQKCTPRTCWRHARPTTPLKRKTFSLTACRLGTPTRNQVGGSLEYSEFWRHREATIVSISVPCLCCSTIAYGSVLLIEPPGLLRHDRSSSVLLTSPQHGSNETFLLLRTIPDQNTAHRATFLPPGWSCLHWSVYNRNPVLTRALISAGAASDYKRASATLTQARGRVWWREWAWWGGGVLMIAHANNAGTAVCRAFADQAALSNNDTSF